MNKAAIAAVTAAAAILLTSACEKSPELPANYASQKYFEAYMALNYPGASPTGMGIYIIQDEPGDGAEWDTSSQYALVSYMVRTLDGKVSANTYEDMAKQLGTYDPANWYGPTVTIIGEDMSYAGIDEMLKGMKTGGKRTAVIPTWLMTQSRYSTQDEYLDNATGNDSAIYTLTLHDQTDDITAYMGHQLDLYCKENLHGADSTYLAGSTDELKFGFYFDSLSRPDDTEMPSDTTVYINYTGRLLNGQIFDTTIENVAKDAGIYSESKTYEPLPVKWGESYSDLTLDGNSTVSGFSGGLFLMHPGEKAAFAFYYALGYSTSGKGIIPGYASLHFDVEMVPKPE